MPRAAPGSRPRWQPRLSWRRVGDRLVRRYAGNAIAVENGIDLAFPLLKNGIYLAEQLLVLAPHAHRDIECHGQSGIEPWRDRLNAQRRWLLRGEISGERSPSDCYIDLAFGYGIDNARRGIGLGIIAIDRITADILDDAPHGQRMRGRCIEAIVTDHLDADSELSQARVVER